DAHLEKDYLEVESMLKQMMSISTIFQGTRNVSEAISAMKGTASILELCEPHVLPPLQTCNDDELEKIKSALKEMNLNLNEFSIT
ncbi:MAG: hypothetical protein KJT03_23915, partial [Verrucomicrobiae bacterium]|nr:hypothetical protein [Verrucomicrobiae bacterium]